MSAATARTTRRKRPWLALLSCSMWMCLCVSSSWGRIGSRPAPVSIYLTLPRCKHAAAWARTRSCRWAGVKNHPPESSSSPLQKLQAWHRILQTIFAVPPTAMTCAAKTPPSPCRTLRFCVIAPDFLLGHGLTQLHAGGVDLAVQLSSQDRSADHGQGFQQLLGVADFNGVLALG